MYDSPIHLIYDKLAPQISETTDAMICTAILNVGINVDKEELIRALNYDRQQYKKGYADGKADSQRGIGRWIINGHRRRCDKCGASMCMIDRDEYEIPDNFCSNCGADMREEKEK